MTELQSLLQNLDDTEETLIKLKILCVNNNFTIVKPPAHHLHDSKKIGRDIPLWFTPVMEPTIGKKLHCIDVDRLGKSFYVLSLDTTPNGLDGRYGRDYWYRFDWTEEGLILENRQLSFVDLVEELNQAETESLGDVGPTSSRLHEAITTLCHHAGIKNNWNKLCDEKTTILRSPT